MNTIEELDFRTATKSLGKLVPLVYVREGQQAQTNITLAAAPDDPPRDQRVLSKKDGLPGLTVINTNPAVIDELDLSVSSTGVLVLNAKGAARRVGLRRGDFIRKVDGAAIETVEDLVGELKRTQGATVLEVSRRGRAGQIRYRR